jgi:hypothetical protein
MKPKLQYLVATYGGFRVRHASHLRSASEHLSSGEGTIIRAFNYAAKLPSRMEVESGRLAKGWSLLAGIYVGPHLPNGPQGSHAFAA